MVRTLQQAAKQLGTTRPALIKLMREAGLLNSDNLPANPMRDKFYLVTKQSQWFHPECGMQYSASTRVTQAGINWLADKLSLLRPAVPPERRRVA